jgi:hypothetical protein
MYLHNNPSKYFALALPIMKANARITLLRDKKRANGSLYWMQGWPELVSKMKNSMVSSDGPLKMNLQPKLRENYNSHNCIEYYIDNFLKCSIDL